MRLVQVALHAEDLGRAADFYTVLLESAPIARFDEPGLLFFDLDGVRLLLDRNARHPSSISMSTTCTTRSSGWMDWSTSSLAHT